MLASKAPENKFWLEKVFPANYKSQFCLFLPSADGRKHDFEESFTPFAYVKNDQRVMGIILRYACWGTHRPPGALSAPPPLQHSKEADSGATVEVGGFENGLESPPPP